MRKVCCWGFILLTLPGYAQGIVKGTVTDSTGSTVAGATLSLLHPSDSIVVDYAVTDENGDYLFSKRRQGNWLLKASGLGLQPGYKSIQWPREAEEVKIDFRLEEDPVYLQAVTVAAQNTGIRYDGDTIRYRADLFADGTERTVSELLDKLPGIDVDDKGNIKAHGKAVDKVLFNGQDYFGDNSQTAVRNLSADMVEDVEVVNNYSEYSLLSGFRTHEATAINVGVKKGFLGRLSGNVDAAGGYKEKYQLKTNLMQLKTTSMLSFIGAYNNTGAEVFSIEDYIKLQGGVSSLVGSGGGRVSLSREESSLLFQQPNVYSRRNGLGNLSFSSQLTPKFRTDAYFLVNDKREKNRNESRNTYFSGMESETVFSEQNETYRTSDLYTGSVTIKYEPNEKLLWQYKGIANGVNLTEKSNLLNDYSSTSFWVDDRRDNRSLKTNHTLSLIGGKKGRVWTAEAMFSYNYIRSLYDLATDSLLLPLPFANRDGVFYGHQKATDKAWQAGLGVGYNHRFNEDYQLKAGWNIRGREQTWQSAIGQEGEETETVEAPDRSRLKGWEEQVELQVVRANGLVRFKAGVVASHYYWAEHSLADGKKNDLFLRPDLSFSLYFTNKHYLTLSYQESDTPVPAEMFNRSIRIENSRTWYSAGKITKKFSSARTTGLAYQLYDLFSNTLLYATANWTRTRNGVTYDYTNTGLQTIREALTGPSSDILLATLNVDKGFSFRWRTHFSGTFRETFLTNYFNSEKNRTRVEQANGKLRIYSNYKGVVNTGVYGEWEQLDNRLSLTGSSVSQFTQGYGAEFKLKFTEKFHLNTDLGYKHTRYDKNSRQLWVWNADMVYRLTKNLELSFRGRNMLYLKDFTWALVSLDGNFQTEQLYRRIPGYLLLNVSYNF